jgi:hypothetical protein
MKEAKTHTKGSNSSKEEGGGGGEEEELQTYFSR